MLSDLNNKITAYRLENNQIPVSDDHLFPHLIGTSPKIAAVLIPLTILDGEWKVLYTRRTDHVDSHKGQVSFPGGAVEPNDLNLTQTALRETFEEIGLQPNHIEILGQLPKRRTVSNFHVTPIIGMFESPYEFRPNRFEVQRIFTVPLRWLANSANYISYTYDETSNLVFKYSEYNGEIVWGITAKITLDLIKTLGLLY